MNSNSLNKINLCLFAAIVATSGSAVVHAEEFASDSQPYLEEIIVSARKRQESLQDTPVAVSVLNETALEVMGIDSLEDLMAGAIPALKVEPSALSLGTLNAWIRGQGNTRPQVLGRDAPIGFYVDEVLVPRNQGAIMKMGDLRQMEVLRGPQGSLYGKNSTGGAIILTTNEPTGEFYFRQRLTAGNDDYFLSNTTIDTPDWNGLKARLNYLDSSIDGWVENTSEIADEDEFGRSEEQSLTLRVRYDGIENLSFDYGYDQYDQEYSMFYFDFRTPESTGDSGHPHVSEGSSKARAPTHFFDNDDGESEGHRLTITWDASENLTFKSITGYREVDNNVRAPFINVFGSNFFDPSSGDGLVRSEFMSSDSFTQEFQLTGDAFEGRLDYVVGAFYGDEEGTMDTKLDVPALPGFQPSFQQEDIESETWAVFGQFNWTPPVLEDRMHLSLGMRYTEDDKSFTRNSFDGFCGSPSTLGISFAGFISFIGADPRPIPEACAGAQAGRFDGSNGYDDTDFSPTISIAYDFTDDISGYFRWANAYRSGGFDPDASDMASATFDSEDIESFELGLKSEFLDNRLRLNLATFYDESTDKQLDFSDPVDITLSRTVNTGESTVTGVEVDMQALLTEGLMLTFAYTYLDWDLDGIVSPDSGLEVSTLYKVPQSPKHAGSLALDYSYDGLSWAQLDAHFDIVSKDGYYQAPLAVQEMSSYTIFNARLTLSEIKLGSDYGALKLALWGKNLSDEDLVTYRINFGGPLPNPMYVDAFNRGRTYGIDFTYEY